MPRKFLCDLPNWAATTLVAMSKISPGTHRAHQHHRRRLREPLQLMLLPSQRPDLPLRVRLLSPCRINPLRTDWYLGFGIGIWYWSWNLELWFFLVFFGVRNVGEVEPESTRWCSPKKTSSIYLHNLHMEVSWNGRTGISHKIDGLFHGKSDLGGFGGTHFRKPPLISMTIP
jgi:hypothetical protein